MIAFAKWRLATSLKIPESKKEPRPITISEAWEREFAEQKGIAYPRDLTVEMSRSFRATWTLHNSAAAKRLDYFKAFFRFCQDAGWGMDNPGKKLKPPQVVDPPTLPFSRAEVDRILAACCDSLELRAFCLLARFSGLRISDLVSTRADQLHDGLPKLRTEKTNV